MQWGGFVICAILCGAAAAAQAVELTLPSNARETAARDSALDQVMIPIGPYSDGALETQSSEGQVTRRTYRIPSSDVTPLQLLAPLRDQVQTAGYKVLLDCNETTCGGFDFRFAIDVLPAPNMYVNIRDYQFVSARHLDTGGMVTLLTSASAGTGYLQIIQVGRNIVEAKVARSDPQRKAPPKPAAQVVIPAGTVSGFEDQLMARGSFVLQSLDFAVCTTTLSEGSAPELAALAGLLKSRPKLRIALVGHTDTVGGLDANIAVSRARARAVRSALINTYGAQGSQIEAEGMGYLSPIASNLTSRGRETNRRVEVIVVSEAE